ncbi:hypothetical protein H9P43_006101 [Blastocladiella emersonii ATCC 22665]|nr:hypothetical protein H9P43_006101 [Blastocladiella emersonii ATCC 22665]
MNPPPAHEEPVTVFDETAEAVSRARDLYQAGDLNAALALVTPIAAAARPPVTPAQRAAWPLFFACTAQAGVAISEDDFRAARDETLLPLLLLNRSAEAQIDLLDRIIPSLCDLRTRLEAAEVWTARVTSLARPAAEAAVARAAAEWLDDADRVRILATIAEITPSTEKTAALAPVPPTAAAALDRAITPLEPSSGTAGTVSPAAPRSPRRRHGRPSVDVAVDRLMDLLRQFLARATAAMQSHLGIPERHARLAASWTLTSLVVALFAWFLNRRNRQILGLVARVNGWVQSHMSLV